MKAPVLRRTSRDLKATAAIGAISLAALATVWINAPIRHSELKAETVSAESPFPGVPSGEGIPIGAQQVASVPFTPVNGLAKPLTIDSLLVVPHAQGVDAVNPENGEVVWSYNRDKDVCSVAATMGSVITTFDNQDAGCGDVVAINAKSGTYRATRSDIAVKDVIPIQSIDAAGTVASNRIELWRNDLVRTVEYGLPMAPQEGDFQPEQDCTITSALTRKDNFVVTNTCPDNPDRTYLRIQDRVPDDSRKPEVSHVVDISTLGSVLVAVGQENSAVYVPAEEPIIISFDKEGKESARVKVAPSPLLNNHTTELFSPQTADLPHHMSWFDGERLYLFRPDNLHIDRIVDGVIGTGIAMGDRLIVPNAQGWAVVNWDNGAVEREIPIDRGGYTGPVSLAVAGDYIIEQRGDTYVSYLTTRTGVPANSPAPEEQPGAGDESAEAPVEEAKVEEAPAEEAPADEAPDEEAPAN